MGEKSEETAAAAINPTPSAPTNAYPTTNLPTATDQASLREFVDCLESHIRDFPLLIRKLILMAIYIMLKNLWYI